MYSIILITGIIVLDQFIKYAVNRSLHTGESLAVIKNVFSLTNVHNTGAAWGIFSGKKWLILTVTVLIVFLILLMMFRMRKLLLTYCTVTLSLIVAGAVGNMIDRIVFSYVRDMFDLCCIGFPVFNLADIAVTTGAFLLAYDTLFRGNRSLFYILEQQLGRKDTHGER